MPTNTIATNTGQFENGGQPLTVTSSAANVFSGVCLGTVGFALIENTGADDLQYSPDGGTTWGGFVPSGVGRVVPYHMQLQVKSSAGTTAYILGCVSTRVQETSYANT